MAGYVLATDSNHRGREGGSVIILAIIFKLIKRLIWLGVGLVIGLIIGIALGGNFI